VARKFVRIPKRKTLVPTDFCKKLCWYASRTLKQNIFTNQPRRIDFMDLRWRIYCLQTSKSSATNTVLPIETYSNN